VSSFLKFLRRVRIHGRECGAVARALRHKIEVNPLSAADKKVLSTTNERKVMSKTTFFKRIALTAVAALGFGMLSVAPSQSAVTAHTLTIDNAADALTLEGGTADSATAVLTHNWVALGSSYDSVVIRAIVTSSNAAGIGKLMLSVTDSYSSTANDATAPNSPRYSFGGSRWTSSTNAVTTFKTTVFGAAARDSITITPGATGTNAGTADRSYGSVIQLKAYGITRAGTYTVSVYTQTSSAGAALVSATPTATWTITATAPSKTATADSTLLVRTGVTVSTDGAANTDSNTLSAATSTATTLTPAYTVEVLQKNGTSTNTAQESYTVTVSGEAFITQGHTCANTTTATYTTRPVGAGGSKTLTGCTPTAGTASKVHVWSTGTAGTATLTFTTVSGLALGTKTFTFFGDATAIAVTTTTKKVIRSGTATAQTSVASVTVTDALGNKVTGEAPAIVSSDVTQIASGSCTDVASGTNATTADGVYSCSVTPVATSSSGKAVTLTIRIQDPAVTTVSYLSTTYAVTMGGAAVTYVLTTDKATYEAGEAMVVTATAKDASGNTPYDGQAGPTIRSNKSLGGTAATADITMNLYYDGVSTSQTRSTAVRTMSTAQTLFAPAASGKFTISGLDGQTTPATVSVSATVGDDAATTAANAASDAAAEAIDAANAATDAANLAAEAADAATVAAEEARDAADAATAAVEALATEVATLMAALKAQITTLANTVAKIAKKVKA
jgi:hypothetical protein